MSAITELKDKILAGSDITPEEAYAMADLLAAPATHAQTSSDIREAAAGITSAFIPAEFEFCSIINGRSGRCPENCKWCAQSAHYKTNCDTYDLVDDETCQRMAHYSAEKGVYRFSFVTSGRLAKGEPLDRICTMMRKATETGIHTCASLGLLSRDELRKLWDAGVRRYHCNLETAPSFFPTLCSTHTIEDKLATIAAARELGFEICSGGIIGMGETVRQRAELALTLRQVSPVSIPLNILCPISGTPLADQPLISEDDILDTVALFRMIHPKVALRFAGGRQRLSEQAQAEAMRLGVNSAIVGDLLTTVGSTIDADCERIAKAGYRLK